MFAIPTYPISAYGLNQVAVTGPNPFLDQLGRNMAALNHSTLTIAPGSRATLLEITDDDNHFHDVTQEVGQVSRLIGSETINGRTFVPMAEIRNEYTYIIRAQGSTSSADNIRISVIRISGQISGFAFDKPLTPGVTYNVLSGGSDQPGHAYSSYVAVCFTPGARVDTPRGPRPVEALAPGDLVRTLDNGASMVRWVFERRVAGQGRNAPVLVPAGALGNRRDLVLSPQHRVLVLHDGAEHLVPVKALVGQRGIVSAPCATVRYLHVLCEGHQLVHVEGAAVETLLPGPMALAALAPSARAILAGLVGAADLRPARPLIGPGEYRRGLIRALALPRLPAGGRGPVRIGAAS